MKKPVRNMVGQGAWYALANAMSKVGGLVLLPLYTNARFLTKSEFGLWGAFEVTAQIAIGVFGLQLAYGVIRFFTEPDMERHLVSTAWWTAVLAALATAIPVLAAVYFLAPEALVRLIGLLVLYIAFEILLTIPLAVFRSREQAGVYTAVIVFKLLLIVAFNLYLVRVRGLGLPGLLMGNAAASFVALSTALVLVRAVHLWRFSIERATARRLLRFSVPLVLAGVGSMVLNASDRYVLLAFRSTEEVGLYTLAAKFGGVINMLAAQPLQLALLPILFRLPETERAGFLSGTVRHLVFLLLLLTIGLAVFTEPVLHVFRSDAFYEGAVPMVPWIALGFAVFGMGIVIDGILTMYERTGIISLWITVAAVSNVVLNLIMIPLMGAMGAALSTLISYLVLLIGKIQAGRKLLTLQLPLASVLGIAISGALVAVGGVYLPYASGLMGLVARAAVVAAWMLMIMVAGWLRPAEMGAFFRVFSRR